MPRSSCEPDGSFNQQTQAPRGQVPVGRSQEEAPIEPVLRRAGIRTSAVPDRPPPARPSGAGRALDAPD
ncbi:protein of unassigned function [Methylobacterium oryzae CBMB20]|uniref:Protein of unassigned function n=1 Tax=Methylobacterium oryzae CBMB20 TaxID=693986 RepID=A0A089NVS3_9HYPH|nr:protein of unassigned function [Methylobacterium oryzae CBMB20]